MIFHDYEIKDNLSTGINFQAKMLYILQLHGLSDFHFSENNIGEHITSTKSDQVLV